MGFVQDALDVLEAPVTALETLTHSQTRGEIGQHLGDLLASVVDLANRVTLLEHPGSTPALVALAVQLQRLQTQLAIAQAEEKKAPGSQTAQIASLQAQIAAAKASAASAAATPGDVSSLSSILSELVSSVSSSATPAAAPSSQESSQTQESQQPAS